MVGVCSVLAVGVGDVRVVTRLLVEGHDKAYRFGSVAFLQRME